MSRTITRQSTSGPLGGNGDLGAKLWPNGEIAIWQHKTFKMDAPSSGPTRSQIDYRMALFRLYQQCPEEAENILGALGLSTHPIFDSLSSEGNVVESGDTKRRTRKGGKGITSYGGRMVRNAAHVLQSEAGKGRLVFATVTLPNLPMEQMRVVHENWDQVTEYYRLNIRRMLQRQGLSGEMVTVSEIQEKRYKKTGLPVLHLHSVFVGKTRIGKFAITTEDHDDAWFRACASLIDIERHEISSACNLQRVKKDAGAYLGKYMSKGVKTVEKIAADGFGGWLPKHWWNCTRSLSARVKSQTRRVDDMADWLDSVADLPGNDVWIWHRKVVLTFDDGTDFTVARYGRLSMRQTTEIQAYY